MGFATSAALPAMQNSPIRLLLVQLCLFAWSADALVCTCTNTTTSANWMVSTSWDCGRVPTSADDVIVPTGANVQFQVRESWCTCVN